MEFTLSCIFWCTLSLLATLKLWLRWIRSRKETKKKKRPPGPRGWPIIGNILDLGTKPHHTLYNLRAKYGPILWIKLGSMNTKVVQSANAAEQLFKNHDLQFCDRKCPLALTAHDYNKGSLAFGQYGPYWRLLRRLCTMEFLINKRINETASLRRKCVSYAMLRQIENKPGAVNLAQCVFLMSFNLVGNLMFSRDLLDSQSEEAKEFFDAMGKISELVGKPNIADYIPLLKWLDPQGVKRGMNENLGKAMKIVGRFVNERAEEQKTGMKRVTNYKDFLDELLEYDGQGKQEPDKISDHNINIILPEMFLAGSETTSSTIEWAMSELLRRPRSMHKAKEELDVVVGPNRKVEESDIDDLPYLQAVVKETLRLHPAVPLLLPRNAIEDTKYMGCHIPKGTQIYVNIWAIGRDPEYWDETLCFKPDRFIGSNIDYKGQNFELLPFGSGRRICVGISLAQRLVHLALASLHTFNWNLVPDQALDMNERVGVSLRKLVPLEATPNQRLFSY